LQKRQLIPPNDKSSHVLQFSAFVQAKALTVKKSFVFVKEVKKTFAQNLASFFMSSLAKLYFDKKSVNFYGVWDSFGSFCSSVQSN
jgi:hypothetical protein